ncbi:hypothetical protein PWT90_10772 [Aphanocladium album]|nr:hypothetical protein PWT90_10772 [Aphanocladium album]
MARFTVLATLCAGASAGALESNMSKVTSSLAITMPSAEARCTAVGIPGIPNHNDVTYLQVGVPCVGGADSGTPGGCAADRPETGDGDSAGGTHSKRRVYGSGGNGKPDVSASASARRRRHRSAAGTSGGPTNDGATRSGLEPIAFLTLALSLLGNNASR